MPTQSYIAVITRRASADIQDAASLTATQLGLLQGRTVRETVDTNLCIIELEVGTKVLVLPVDDALDCGWVAVVYKAPGLYEARMGWVLPWVLTPWKEHPETEMEVIQVHRIHKRGGRAPSLIVPDQVGRRSGIHHWDIYGDGDDFVVLNAAWYQEHHRRHGATPDCSGHCASVVQRVATDKACMYDVLDFAFAERGIYVFCHHAVHRSVATAHILIHAMGRRVNWDYAKPQKCWRCCNRPIWEHLNLLWASLRTLPQNSDARQSFYGAVLGL